MIDPEIFDSAEAKDWTADDFAVMVAAICSADDEGRGRITQIKKSIISMIPEKKFQKSLRKLSDSIKVYSEIYFFLPKFKNYQTISHPKPSKFPEPNLTENKDLTQKTSIIFPELVPQNDGASPSQVSLKEVNLIKVNVSESNVDNFNNSNFQPSNFDLPLPLLTEEKEFQPQDFDNKDQVTESVKLLLTTFCNIQEPKKEEISSFVNVVMNTKQVKNSTAFKYVFDTFNEFSSYPAEKRNLKYVYSRVHGRINDALILAREHRAKVEKEKEKEESALVNNNDIEQIANKFQIN